MTLLIFVASLLGAMAIGVPVAFALIFCSLMMMLQLDMFNAQIVAQNMISGADTFTLLAIPFFLLAGELMNSGGLSRRIIDFALTCVGHIKGGLGLVAIVAAVIMASLSGSAVADSAALAAILVPMMREAGYNVPRSAGVIAAGGVIAPVIPPSMAFIIFGVAANVSISRLFMAGIVPGLLMALTLVVIWMTVGRNSTSTTLPKRSGKERLQATARAAWALGMPVIVLGGIRMGIVTPTEAAVVAAVYAWLVGTFIYKELRLRDLYFVLLRSAKTTSVVMFLVAAALVSAWLITAADIPSELGNLLEPFIEHPKILMLIMMLLIFVIGTALDLTPTLLILTPVLLPVVKMAGIDPVYFGVMFVMNTCISLLTPPVGVVLNVVSGVAKVPLGKVIVGVGPFLLGYFVLLMLFVAVPEIITVPMKWLY